MRNSNNWLKAKLCVPAILGIALCAPTLTSCDDDDPVDNIIENIENLTWLPDTYTKSETLPKGVYTISGTLHVTGNAVLTIAPGTVINFKDEYSGIKVDANAGLKMIGTKEEPILLTSLSTSKGAWDCISYYSNNANNVMKFVEIVNGGSGTYDHSCVVYVGENARLSVEECNLVGSVKNGFYFQSAIIDRFDKNSVSGCGLYPILITDNTEDALRGITADNKYIANEIQAIRLGNYSGVLADKADFTLIKMPIPYHVQSIKAVNKTLTIEAGATIAFTEDNSLNIEEKACLKAIGTEDENINIVCLENIKSWSGVRISSANTNVMKYVNVKNAPVVIYENAKLAMDYCTIDGSNGYGLDIRLATLESFTNNTISNCENYPIYFYDSTENSLSNLGTGNKYENNTNNYIRLGSYTSAFAKDATFHKQAIPYSVEGLTLRGDGKSLHVTIEPGTTILTDAQGDIIIDDNAQLIAEGTAEEPIVFGCISDDNYWTGMTVKSNMRNAVSLANCVLRQAEQAAITLGTEGILTMKDVQIKDCRNYGFKFDDETSDMMKLTQSNVTFENCEAGNIHYNYAETEVADEFAEAYPLKHE